MTATIGGLLDRLHLLAYRLDPSGPPLPVETAHLAAEGAEVAPYVEKALGQLMPEPPKPGKIVDESEDTAAETRDDYLRAAYEWAGFVQGSMLEVLDPTDS